MSLTSQKLSGNTASENLLIQKEASRIQKAEDIKKQARNHLVDIAESKRYGGKPNP
jgi:hypothetical protein